MSLLGEFRKKAARESTERNGQHTEGQPPADGDIPPADGDIPPAPEPPFPDPPSVDAFFGLADDIVNEISPHSEADPVALLVQLLVAFGNYIGRIAHFMVEGTPHYCNLFGVLVGITSKGRKGTSWGRVHQLMKLVDDLVGDSWAKDRVASGLSSGEGLIWAVRDPIVKREPIKEKGRIIGSQEVVVDDGIEDKRLLVLESEFANVLKQTERTGNTLSAILRQAWETGIIRSLIKNSPNRTTGAHISVVGHITDQELRRYLSSTESASGFGNRFLWFSVRRSKCLPEGGGSVVLDSLAKSLAEAVGFGKAMEKIERDNAARDLWHSVYPELSEGRPGLVGALTARAEAQVMRLASIYALLECSNKICEPHLKAGLALWEFSERCTRHIFGDSTGDPLADEIAELLKTCSNGMSQSDLSHYFGRHQSASRLARACNLLLTAKLVTFVSESTGGRPVTRWFAVEAAKKAKKAK